MASIGKGLGMAVILATGAAGVAQAQADPLANYYGNTVHETRANGSQMWVAYAPDHSVKIKSSDGRNMSATYAFDPATRNVCLKMPPRPPASSGAGAPPAGAPPTAAGAPPAGPPRGPPCAPMPDVKVGESWTRTGPTGQPETYVLESGMAAFDADK